METTSIVWIVVAVVVGLALIAAIVLLSRNSQRKHRRIEADRLREEARVEEQRVNRREALAQETEARARAAQAEADAKAAEAARLNDRAATHRTHAVSSREELDAQWQRADELDPKRDRVDDRADDGAEQQIDQRADGHYRDDVVQRDINATQPTVDRHPQHR